MSQLAVDLLVASLSLKQIGVFDTKCLVSVVGGREDDEEGITTPLECMNLKCQSTWHAFLTNGDEQYTEEMVLILSLYNKDPLS